MDFVANYLAARVLGNLIDRLLPFGKDRRERLEDVDHVLPDVERYVDAGLSGALGDAGRVVEQRLRGADLDQQRRQAGKVRIERRGERRPWMEIATGLSASKFRSQSSMTIWS